MQRKKLSADGMIKIIGNSFSKIQDHRHFAGEQTKYSIKDTLLTSFAAFSLKYDSLKSFFDELKESKEKRMSIKYLYQTDKMPSTTRLKEIIDPIKTDYLRPAFKDIFREIQRGGALKNFLFMDKYYILALDGTGYYSSEKVKCKCCLVKKHKTGKTTYSHQMLVGCIVHPLMKQVIPVAPEPIQNIDGTKKNDCERNSAKRFLSNFRKDHPKLPIIVTEDALASNAPHIKELWKNNMNFILGVKPGDHKYLFDWVKSFGELSKVINYKYTGKKIIRRITQEVRFVNEVPLNDANNDLLINFIEVKEFTEKKLDDGSWYKEGKTTTFSWVTDIQINENNALNLMFAGRKRWSIENETFNTLKNNGYNFEHSYGHGKENLATNFAFLMLLAFLVDQVQEMCCRKFQKALERRITKKSLWRKLRSLFDSFILNMSWNELLERIANPSFELINST